jgi:inner membrane protein
VLALATLPFVLTGGLILLNRLTRWRGSRAVVPKQLLLLCSTAILSHPVLDTLNTYGVRWLMPFSGRWYYGDALFIVDPWVWLALGIGVLRSGRQNLSGAVGQTSPARWALVIVIFYMGSMWISGSIASTIISRQVEALSGKPVLQAMAGPVPLAIFSRSFVAQQDAEFQVGEFHWLALPQVNPSRVSSFPRGRPAEPAFAIAESTLVMRRFLGWARFPTFVVEETGRNHYLVHAVDLRYARGPADNFGTVSIPVSLPSASGPF